MKLFLLKLVLVLFIGLALRTLASAADDRPLRVVALHTVLTEIAREVGGPRVEVIGLVQPGIDPHAFDPSAADMRKLVDADLVLVSGLHLELYLDRLAAQRGPAGHVVAVGDALPSKLSLTSSHTAKPGTIPSAPEGETDPHWWHSIDNVLFATDLVRAEYSRLRPAWTDDFARNAQAYEERLVALKSWVATEIAKLPPQRRQLVTSHDAFGYFARDYGFTVHPIGGFSTEGEPDAKHLAHLIDFIRAQHIKAVFAENDVNPRLVSNLVSETGVRLGSSLYSDGLGPAGTDAATYELMVRHNVSAIVEALR
jgi:zinc/manganese transport system substrate-binding protein